MRCVRAFVVALAISASLAACGGGGGDSRPPTTPTPPAPPPQNPCASAQAVPDGGPERPAATDDAPRREAIAAKARSVDAGGRWGVLDAIWTHRARRDPADRAVSAPAAISQDVGDIAVLQDQGDLIVPRNAFDLANAGLRFTRNSQGGYDVSRADATFRSTLGQTLSLGDDDSSMASVPFAFPLYGKSHTAAFVNSDGNITFEEEDRASTERNVSRLLTGPPRIALFLADLDPSVGGRVFLRSSSSEFTVTWCNIRGFESNRTVTAQVTLLPDGIIEMKYESVGLGVGVVGVSPGRTGMFMPVDLSAQGPLAGGSAAVGERFADRVQLDTVATARAFYQTHPDTYDQLVIWSDAALTIDAFAYEETVANEIRGIGLNLFELSRDYGSAGALRSLAVMDFLGKYPDDPGARFLGENSTVSVLGQEVGHRWLSFMRFRDHENRRSDALLGRGLVHWSFFTDSDASVMEGNDIEDLGGGAFRTVAAVQRYSDLDQYAMGILGEHEVRPFFYVENPTNVTPFKDRDSGPQVGVTMNGTRRDVLIQDIIAAEGPRQPSAAQSPRVHRQAFIFVVGADRSATAEQLAKLARIINAWVPFFAQATNNRMRAEVRLRVPS